VAKKLDVIVVIDVEATAWQGKPPCGMTNEIIEIGIATIDVPERRVTSTQSVLVKPMFSEISDFCTKITTITKEMVDLDGIAFSEALELLKRDYHTESRTWASWGSYDRMIFARQCRTRKVQYPFGKSHINIKNLFALTHKLQKEVEMPEAMQMLCLDFEGVHHRGIDDAKNAATILTRILQS
jgi:inhibitor of KinA sporulation pathway (predicted exonuclease)